MEDYDKYSASHAPTEVPNEANLAPDRIARLLRVLSVIQSHGAVQGESLPVLAGVSRRTLFRDLQLLRDAGVPVEYSRQSHSFSIAGEYFLGPINLDPAETEALALAFVLLEHQEMHPWREPLRRAEAKITTALRDEHRPRWNAVLRNIDVAPPPASATDPIADVFSTIHTAINDSRVLQIEIDGVDERPESVTLRPCCLAFIQVRWYVFGQSPDQREPRLLPLDRMVRVALRPEHFENTGPSRLKAHLRNAWRIETGKTEYAVCVRFDARVAEDIETINWHSTQETHWQEDGRLVFRARVSGLSEVARWVLSYGPMAEVVEPPELQALVRDAARLTAARYA